MTSQRLAQRRRRSQVPHADGAILAAADRDRTAIDRPDCDCFNPTSVATEGNVDGRGPPPGTWDAPWAIGEKSRDPVGDRVDAPHAGGQFEVTPALVGRS